MEGKQMEDTQPEDFEPLASAGERPGLKAVFGNAKNIDYHVRKVAVDLIQAGAMARIGSRIFLHKTRFWPEYQRIMAKELEARQ